MNEIKKSLTDIANRIASYEPEATQSGMTTGEASGGREFEKTVRDALSSVFGSWLSGSALTMAKVIVCEGLKSEYVGFLSAILNIEHRKAMISRLRPSGDFESMHCLCLKNSHILQLKYQCDLLYDDYIPKLKSHIPTDDREDYFVRERYPLIYSGKTTRFDESIVFCTIEQGCVCGERQGQEYFSIRSIHRKYLIEIKVAKSSTKHTIDGNAHERLSFQNLEYLNICLREPHTDMLVLTNDAFLRYRNKYHAAFGVHAYLLSSQFPTYRFLMISTVSQYVHLFMEWYRWLTQPS